MTKYVKVSQHTHARAYKCVARHRLVHVVYGTKHMKWKRIWMESARRYSNLRSVCMCLCARDPRCVWWMNISIFLGPFAVHIMRCSGHRSGAHRATHSQPLTASAFLLCTARRSRLSYFFSYWNSSIAWGMIQNHIHKRPNVCCVWFYSSALPSPSSSSFFLFPIFECRPNLYLSNTIEKRSGKNQFLFSLRVHPSLLLLSIILFFFTYMSVSSVWICTGVQTDYS